jgi:cilia- and flagella-associated protein 52
MELEHAIGYLAIDNGLFYHPNARDIVYSAGGTVIVCDLNDPHAQSILIGHDANVTCLALSRGGRLIASGQHGENADAIVWDFEARKELYRLSEHDHGIQVSTFCVMRDIHLHQLATVVFPCVRTNKHTLLTIVRGLLHHLTSHRR